MSFGIAIIAGHNLLDGIASKLVETLSNDAGSALWKICYVGFSAGPFQFGTHGPSLIVLYSIVPWIGVMAAGYAFGRVLMLPATRRDRVCLALALGATALFLLLRSINHYGDPHPWSLAPKADGVILVVEADRTPVADAESAKKSLDRVGARIFGVVLNRQRSYVPAVLQALL